jgi:hypothetical protein
VVFDRWSLHIKVVAFISCESQGQSIYQLGVSPIFSRGQLYVDSISPVVSFLAVSHASLCFSFFFPRNWPFQSCFYKIDHFQSCFEFKQCLKLPIHFVLFLVLWRLPNNVQAILYGSDYTEVPILSKPDLFTVCLSFYNPLGIEFMVSSVLYCQGTLTVLESGSLLPILSVRASSLITYVLSYFSSYLFYFWWGF